MKKIIVLLISCLLLTGCRPDPQPQAKTVFCMDTVMDLTVWGGKPDTLEKLEALLTGLEQSWSVTDGDSLLSQLNRGEAPALSGEQRALLEQAEELSAWTGGAFNPHLHALSLAWGFYDGNYRVPTQEEIDQALTQNQWDLGGILKGYAGAACVRLLEETGVQRAILVLGGNVQTYGSKPDGAPWQIGIQNPGGGDPIALLEITGTQAIVTSGDYQRYFEENGARYHHILDPATGHPSRSGLRSVTVVCNDGAAADALSTALFVMGLEKGIQFWRDSGDFEAVFLSTDGRLFATDGLNLSGCGYEVISR